MFQFSFHNCCQVYNYEPHPFSCDKISTIFRTAFCPRKDTADTRLKLTRKEKKNRSEEDKVATAATTMRTVLNRNSVTIWKKKKKRKRDEGIEEPVLTAPADLAFLLFALSPPRNRKYARGENDWVDAADTPRSRSRFWLATPTSPITIAPGAGFPRGGARPLALGK